MFKPDYRISEHFLDCAEKIATVSAKIVAKNVKFSLMTRLQAETLERNVHSSTSIEGNPLSLAQVSDLNRNKDLLIDDKSRKEVVNYFKALRWIIKEPARVMNKSSLLQLHELIVDGLLSQEKAGCFKIKQNFIIDAKKIVVYTPPPPKDCPRLLGQLVDWVNQPKKIHPIILSAIFHHQLVTIHPFSDGNGRVARAGAQWLLYQKKFDHYHIIALDDFYAQDRGRYYAKIQQVRDLDYDFTYWIDYVAQGLLETIEKVYLRLSNLAHGVAKKITITPKQEELVDLLGKNGALGSRELCRLLKINRARVNQLIVPLISAKIIQKSGFARATRYCLNRD
jgi:Fic family protein